MTDLNNAEEVKKLDKSGFRQFILGVPDQFEVGFNLAKDTKIDGEFENVVISGMGGSALPANLLRSYCSSLFKTNPDYKQFEIYINRYYSLPPESYNPKTLNIISSYSGTTEEIISALEEAQAAGLPYVGISSGGTIEELCKKYNAPHIHLPIPFDNFQPRMGTGYFFGSMYQILINAGLAPDTTPELLKSAKKLNDSMGEAEEFGKTLALKLKGNTPVIYASPRYKYVAMVWKIKTNENAKTPAFWNFFPEANHNEMVGYTNPQAKFFIIMLKDPEDNPKNLKRYDATAKLLKEKGIESEIIELQGGNDVFYKIFSTLTIADWTSYYLALCYDQDPTPVDMVELLKKILVS